MKGTKRFSLITKTRRDKEIQIHPYTDYIESPVTLNGRKFLRCSTCLKYFFSKATLKLHLQTHSGVRRFTCKVCGKMFITFSSFNAHEKTHWPVKPYACSVCGKGFVLLRELKTHSHMHSGEMPFFCNHCGQGFTSFRNLERHRLLHRAASSHYCLPCKLPFPSYLALKNHLKAHKARPVIPLPEGPLEPLRFPYHCRKCNARFTTTDLLQAHQVCHLIGGKKTYSSSANVVSASLTSKLSNKPRARVTPLSPTTVPSLLLLSSVHDSPCNTVSLEHEGRTSPSNNCCEANNSDLPQCSCPSCVLIYEPTQCMPKTDTPHMPTHEPPCPLDNALSLLGYDTTSLAHLYLGSFSHFSLQILSYSVRLDGERRCTAIFRSLQRCSIGFKSGLWLGHSRIFRDLSQSHSCVVLAVCLGPSCWGEGSSNIRS
uniref:C2H2-type domain-containing protein n=1 Tax=Oncorhynchus mykiss TaxID=8022 RepID=A0A8C7WGR9_ONCMY